MPLADLTTLIDASSQNLSQLKGLSFAYNLLGGAPSIAGYTKLINDNNDSNFGAGPGTMFNDENVYINTLNALYQGNTDAKTAFDAIVSGGASLSDKLDKVYDSLIPAADRTDAGRTFFKSQSSFYEARAIELGVAGTNGAALVGYAALSKIAYDNDIGGLGDTVNDLVAAIANGTAALPEDGTVFTPLETADGTAFDDDDVNPNAVTLTVGVDVLTGNVFNAPRVFDPAGDDPTNSLNDDDVLTGMGDNPTLNLSYVNDIDGGAGGFQDQSIQAKLNGIQTVNIDFRTDRNSTLDLQDSTGVQSVKISGVDDGLTVGVANITSPGGLKDLHIQNSGAPDATVFVTGTDTAFAGKADSLDLKLDNAQLGQLFVQERNGSIDQGYEMVNLSSIGEANSIGQTFMEDLQTMVVSGDKALTLGSSAQVFGGNTQEATNYGAGFGNVAGSFSSLDASALKAGITVNLGTEVTALKDDTSGVKVDFSFKGTDENDVVRLLNGLDKNDSIDLGAGDNDQVALFQSATAGSIAGTESVSILSGHDDEGALNTYVPAATADVINFDTSIAPDLKDIFIRNEGQDFGVIGTAPASWYSAAEDMTVNLTKVSSEVAKNLTIAHGTTGNNGITDNLVTVGAATDGAADVLGLKIVDGTNADPRFNMQLKATTYESLTFTDSDSESNSILVIGDAKAGIATHSDTVTVTGGSDGTFFNLDVTANLLQKDLTGLTAGDEAAVSDVGAAAAERFSAAKIDASGSESDVIVRVDTLRDAKGVEQATGGQTILMGKGDDFVIFDAIAGATKSTAGLTISDTVSGGEGKDTLVIDGNGTNVVISASEWTNVTGFETVHLVGNGQADNNAQNMENAYNLVLTNDFIDANGGDVINIVNDNGGKDNTVFTSLGANDGATIDARQLSASNSFSYDGQEANQHQPGGVGINGTDTVDTRDRFILADANINGSAKIDGGAIVNEAIGANILNNIGSKDGTAANSDVLEVRNAAVITVGDLANISNVGTIELTVDAAADQNVTLQLDNATVDRLVNTTSNADGTNATTIGQTAELLTIRAFDNPALPTASAVLKLDATGVTNAALQLNITGASEADTIVGGAGNDIISGGAGNDTLTGGGGADQFRLPAPAATPLNGTDTITDFAVAQDAVGLLQGGGGWNAAGTNPGVGAFLQLAAADYVEGVASATALVAATHDQRVVELNASRTTVQMNTDTSGAATADIYVLVHNSITGKGELWFDTDWNDVANREHVATFDNVTTLVGVTDFTNANFVEFA